VPIIIDITHSLFDDFRQCVKTFPTSKTGHTGTLNKGCSHREKESCQDFGGHKVSV
jgi:hypothetical protein